ncbi:hypothetical protein ANCCAN_04040 [Ancylostoma caninum]|uniref:Uncharacterized protein n=1 Tax=Ancylostoma caninum TaxID=29170 RepID=A0A368H3G5_ANCCA|nr:hypothetical protein ANCCAN_04040 [Ancylostoma caninum]
MSATGSQEWANEIRQIMLDRITTVSQELHEKGLRWGDMFTEEDNRAIETFTIETVGESAQEAEEREARKREFYNMRMEMMAKYSNRKTSIQGEDRTKTVPCEESEVVPDDPIPQSAAVQKDPDKTKKNTFEEEPRAGSSRMDQRWNASTISITIEEVVSGDRTGRINHQQLATGVTTTMETQQTTGIALTIEGVVGAVRVTDFTVMVDGQMSAAIIVNQMNRVIALMAFPMEKETARSVLVTKGIEFLGTGLNTMAARSITELLFQLYLYVGNNERFMMLVEVAAINTA